MGALLSTWPSGLRGPRHTPPKPYSGRPQGRADRKSEVCPHPSARAELPVTPIRGCGQGPALHRGAGYRFWLRRCRPGPAGSPFNPSGPRAPHLYDGAAWEATRSCGDERSAGPGLCRWFGDIITVWRLLRSLGTDGGGARAGRSCGACAPPPRVLPPQAPGHRAAGLTRLLTLSARSCTYLRL